MTRNYSPPWNLRCVWCDWYIVVNARGMRGNDMGSGVEAAETMERHVGEAHHKTWVEFLRDPAPSSMTGEK